MSYLLVSFIGWQQMVFCGRKDIIKGDIMIDDHPKNLFLFEGRKVLFTQPHNIHIHNDTFERVFSWEEVMKLLYIEMIFKAAETGRENNSGNINNHFSGFELFIIFIVL